MSKNLPIQFVETRGEQDVFLKEGGGNSEPPKWVTNDTIERNAVTLRRSFESLDALFDNREDNEDSLPLLVVATLHEKATAKSYRANVRNIFDTKKKRNIIGVSTPRDLIVKIDNKSELHRISSIYNESTLLSLCKLKRVGVAAIVDLSAFKPEVEDDLIGHTIKIRLVDYLDEALNMKSEKIFLSLCAKHGFTVHKANYAPGLRIYCLKHSANTKSIEPIITMDSVISVKKMPYIDLSISPEPYNTKLEVKLPREGEEYPIVGLLDSGIASIPHLSPWIQDKNYNIADFDEFDLDFRHGTTVAGVMNYGDELENSNWTGCSPMKIVSCIVNTNPHNVQVDELEMIEHIRAAVQSHPDVKVWNLSQGSSYEVCDNCFSDFAMALDCIQKEFNVLFCKSAGNIDYLYPDKCRITQGADSICSLVVGSIADRFDREGDAEIGQRSPFSRIGPGPENLIKPDLVHYGGNTHAKIHSFTEVGYECGVLSGTSYSTPRITALAANLAHRINKDFDPVLIKALLIHSSSHKNSNDLDNMSLLHEQGYGLPANLNDILNNDADEFTMIWHPSFLNGDAQIQDIPFPSSMVGDDGLFYGDITVTVVSDPILKGSEGTEYCQSDVEVLLQTYDHINYIPLYAVGTPRFYRNSDRLSDPKNILGKSLYIKSSHRSSDWEERTLIESEFKYQPVKKYHVNLEKMHSSSRRRYLNSTRKWCLSIKALYRDSVTTDRYYDGINGYTRAVVVITIKDTKHKGVAYSECFASLDNHNFSHSDLEIRQRINIVNEHED